MTACLRLKNNVEYYQRMTCSLYIQETGAMVYTQEGKQAGKEK